jgi:hypothetical protein
MRAGFRDLQAGSQRQIVRTTRGGRLRRRELATVAVLFLGGMFPVRAAPMTILPLSDLGLEPVGRIHWLGDVPGWVGAEATPQGPAHGFVTASPGRAAQVLARLAGDRACEPIPGAGVMVAVAGGSGAVFLRPGAATPEVVAGTAGDPIAACLQRTGTVRLALAQQGFEVSGVAVSGETTIACRVGEAGRSEIWRINGTERLLLAAVTWPLARDNPVLEFQSFEDACLIYPSLLPRRRAELRSQLPGIPVVRAMPNGTVEEDWIAWGDWNAEGGYRVASGRDGLAVGILHGWTDLGERHSGLWRPGAAGWERVAPGQLDPGSLSASPDGRRFAWREQRQQPAGAPRRFRHHAMLLETGAA